MEYIGLGIAFAALVLGGRGVFDYLARLRATRAEHEVGERPVSRGVLSGWSKNGAALLARRGEYLVTPHGRVDVGTRLLDADALYETLAELYPAYPCLELWGERMPIWARRAPTAQTDPESILGPLTRAAIPPIDYFPDTYFPGSRTIFDHKRLQQAKLPASDRFKLRSDPTYSMQRLAVAQDGTLRVDTGVGRYLTFIATCAALEWELLAALESVEKRRAPVDLSMLPHRRWLHATVADPVLDGSARDAAIGLLAVVILRNQDGTFSLVLPTRSEDTAIARSTLHVAPAGMFAPFSDDPLDVPGDYSVRWNILREFVEELYGNKKAEGPESHFDRLDLSSEPPVQRLESLFAASPGSGLYLTGMSVNLLTLQPEVCLLLFIDDPDWVRREATEQEWPLRFGWEIERQGRGHLGWRYTLDETLQPTPEMATLRANNLVPSAAAGIHMAVARLRELLSNPIG